MSVQVLQDHVAEVLATIKAIANAGNVLVGIPSEDNARSDSPIGNAAIGYINEFGSPAQGIPPRPFLAPGIAKVQDKCGNLLAMGAADALTSMSVTPITVAQNKAGLTAQNSVKATITAGEGFAPLSASTLSARKKRGVSRTKPLIDTGSLRNSITYVIRKGKVNGGD